MTLSRIIALRYVRPRRLNFITIIGLLSMVGIVIGTAALVIVLSIFNGFRNVARDLMVGFGPHLRIVAAQGAVLPDTATWLQSARSVGTAVPVTESRVVLQFAGLTGVATAMGVPADATLDGVRRSVLVGSFVTHDADGLPGLVVGAGLAEKMQVFLGDTVTLLSPEMIETALTTMVRPGGRRAVVRGLFQSNTLREVDNSVLFTSDALVRSLRRHAGITSIDVTLRDAAAADDVAATLRARTTNDVQVLTWQDINRGLYDTMRLERIGSFIVLTLIVVVAAFNILVTLTLGVVEKRRDIAVLKTVGMTDRDVSRIFTMQGVIIGVTSVVMGVVIGVGLVLGQQTFGWIRFAEDAGYLVPTLPVDVHVLDVLVTAATGLALSSLAAIYPARRAARAVVAEAIRVE